MLTPRWTASGILALALAGCAFPESEEAGAIDSSSVPDGDWQAMIADDGAACLLGARDDEGLSREVLAWDLADRAPRWRARVRWSEGPWNVSTGIFAAEGALVIVLDTGLAALDMADGRERWNALDGAHVAGLGAANGAFYAVVEGERFVALDLGDGRELGSVPAPADTSYFGPESLSPGGRSAILVAEPAPHDSDVLRDASSGIPFAVLTDEPERPPAYYRVALWPELGRLEPARGPVESASYARDVLFAHGGRVEGEGDVQLALGGDEEAPRLQGWAREGESPRWEIDLHDRVKRSEEDEPTGDRRELWLHDDGAWFLLDAGSWSYELRRAEDASVACTWSFSAGEAPSTMTTFGDLVLIDTSVTLGRPNAVRLYDTRDCSLQWTGAWPRHVDVDLARGARRLVHLEEDNQIGVVDLP